MSEADGFGIGRRIAAVALLCCALAVVAASPALAQKPRFGGPTNSFATQVVMLAGGRMLVGGGISSPKLASGGGFAIAKYLR